MPHAGQRLQCRAQRLQRRCRQGAASYGWRCMQGVQTCAMLQAVRWSSCSTHCNHAVQFHCYLVSAAAHVPINPAMPLHRCSADGSSAACLGHVECHLLQCIKQASHLVTLHAADDAHTTCSTIRCYPAWQHRRRNKTATQLPACSLPYHSLV